MTCSVLILDQISQSRIGILVASIQKLGMMGLLHVPVIWLFKKYVAKVKD